MTCTSTPISWLRLEQHHVSPDAAITAHLAECEACAACLAKIVDDESAPLPALVMPSAQPKVAPATPRRISFLRRAAAPMAALALAAAILFFLSRGPRVEPSSFDPMSARVKGGEVSLTLVRDDDTLVAEGGGSYRDGDRWKALVTCPPGLQASWDLVVYESGVAAFPLAAPAPVTCGNAVPLAGAFRTTGQSELTVCLVWSEHALDRGALARLAPDALPHSACKALVPAPAPAP